MFVIAFYGDAESNLYMFQRNAKSCFHTKVITNELTVKWGKHNYNNIQIIKGEFPKTADSIHDSKFSFVHLDVDLYRSTIECLKFFYPRLVNGGIILVHDYHSDGIQKAFKEFLQSNKVQLIELTGSQCMIIKN